MDGHGSDVDFIPGFFSFSSFDTRQCHPTGWTWSASGGVLVRDAAMGIRIPAGLPIPFDRAGPVWYT